MSDPVHFWGNPATEDPPSSKLRRIKQISESHCGPATLQMLLSHLDIKVSQQALAHAIQAEEFIEQRGTNPSDLALAVSRCAPEASMWIKEHTTLEDLDTLVNQFQYPVGVEWQNLFYASVEEEWEDTNGHPNQHDFGHYSVIQSLDIENDEVVMIDPYLEFDDEYRYFSLRWFESRWWDYNEIKDPHTGHIYNKRDERLSLIITLKGMPFPKMIGMRPLS